MTSAASPEFWLYLPQMRMSFGAITERARAAEQAGFDGIALMDHLAPPGLPSADMYDAITTAAVIAMGTAQLRIGHLVLCSSFRHPAVLAQQMVSLDHLSGGRCELGIGWGSVPGELTRFRARMLRPANQPRFRSASRLFLARISVSSDTTVPWGWACV